MSKKLKYIALLCLSLCLVLGGCTSDDNKPDNDTSSDDSRIYAPTEQVTDNDTTEAPTDTLPEETTEAETTRPDYPSDIIIDPDPVYIPEDTEPDMSDETDTDIAEPDETVTLPEATVEKVELGEAFLSGDPASGSLVSKEHDKIQLVVNYNCEMNIDGSINVDLQVGLNSYDINCGARGNSGKLTVGGEVYTFSTDAIVHEEREMIFVPFASYNHQVAAGETSLKIGASWLFNGVYAGEKIDTLDVNAVLTWDSPSVDDTAEATEESAAE
ncbi:MAG: hypothetical protein IJY93_05060 [Clostridia bacterium]|nr:hypothetical protein [Clostridia bacterium]